MGTKTTFKSIADLRNEMNESFSIRCILKKIMSFLPIPRKPEENLSTMQLIKSYIEKIKTEDEKKIVSIFMKF